MYSIFKTFVLSLLMIAQVHFAYAQNAAILPPAKTTFVDQNGKPLTSGTVDFYIPGTTTRKTTWQDEAATIPNTNPVVLDGAGRALILGSGSYRQVVKDRLSNVVWDQVTSSVGAGGGGGSTIGDGLPVGTILPWSGIVAPVNYQFTYGQELSRTTYSALYQAITYLTNIGCSSGNPVITLTDTTSLSIGTVLESACTSGSPTIISKTPTSVTLSANALVTVSTPGRFFLYGNGNGLTTFNAPDTRGYVLAGRCNMGGADCSVLSSTYFSSNLNNTPSSMNAKGGTQSQTLLLAQLPNVASTGSNVIHVQPSGSSGFNVPITTGGIANQLVSTSGSNNVPQSSVANWQGTNDFFASNVINVTSLSTGGVAVSATIASGGSGYTNGSQILTATGGTCTVAPQFTVTVVANAITAPVLLTAGSCTVQPPNPAVTSGGGGTGGTLSITYSAAPFSKLQPTMTMNYVIKTTPDVSLSSTFGVASIGGMTGIITCGTNVICAGNDISVNIPTGTVFSIGGMTGIIACGNGIACSANTVRLAQNNAVTGQYVSGVDASGNITRSSISSVALPVISITDYAVCDGVTNDTTAIQTWMNALPNKLGYMAPGLVCRYTGLLALPSNSRIWAYGATLFQLGSDAGSANSGIVPGPFPAAQIGNSDNVWIYGLTIDGNRANNTNTAGSGALIYVIGGVNFIAKDVSVVNGRGDGIYAGGSTTLPFTRKSTRILWDNVYASNNYRNGGSVVGVDYMEIRGGIYQQNKNTNGNGPMNGIDFEPNDAASSNSDISVYGSKFLVNGDASLATTGGVGLSCYTTFNARITISNVQSDSNLRYGYEVGLGAPNQCTFTLAKGAANGTALMSGLAYDATALLSQVVKTANYTITPNENAVTFNCGASCTLTLPAASDFPGRTINVKTIAAQPVVSASSNIIPLGGGAATTSIVIAGIGRYAILQSDGSNWQTLYGNP